ncbi:binding-protein-dependent transport systems inner membrane component [Beutenbergia cavernae DSM 12333]|uniref:Binding-protein-dependent transport systems inner membrane component n=1 Tax=Beutenbergia cavernae (strain ATCC BAA-8 / DSM 12333 / CCUG 43141 / JCM 11478 / NBRC 16432 / NCIMB 13614 / HKI 0122) TaxID=471853 RepID=C5BVL6_BEUC1|nr:sugar ABC transporter permease [Beutenbergia cavernae]ACQ78456.1 binding-protein-dependent transport systems inner membrane component [Beutenbergia cavernae DSM 12333]
MTADVGRVADQLARHPRRGSSGPASRRLARLDAVIGLSFVAPVVIGVVALGLVPFGFVIWYALHDWSPLIGEFTWTGTENFTRLFADAAVWEAFGTTLKFAALLMVLNICLAMALALLLNTKLRGTTTFRTFFFSPVIVSTVAWVLVWNYLVAANGGVNGFLAMIGIQGPNWLRDPAWALVTLVVIQVFKGVGMNMILFLAALQNVPGDLKEAARIDGASPTRVFRSITLPLITPTILLVTMITMIGAMDVFAPIQIMTQGGPGRSTTVISYLLYKTAFEQQDFGYASAIGVALFVVVLVFAALQWGSRKKWVHDEV